MDQILEMLGRLAELNLEELQELERLITEEFGRLEQVELTTETVAAMEDLATHLEQVRTAGAEKIAAEQQLAARVAELSTQVHGTEPETPAAETTPEEATPDDGETPVETPAEEPPVETPPAEEPPVEPATEAVAAAAPPPAPLPARAPLRTLAATRPRSRAPMPDTNGGAVLVAAADVGIVAPGAPYPDMRTFGEAMARRYFSFAGQPGSGEKITVGTVVASYPEERQLAPTLSDNMEKIDAILASINQESIQASGGFCAPTEVRYDFMNVSEADRPVRDALVRFNANRGGIRFIPPPHVSDLSAAVTMWTHENDANPTNPTTKPCLHVDCGIETEVQTDAIVRCLEFGNFDARTFPERVNNLTDLAMAWHARFAERNLLDTIDAGSTQVTSTQILGATRDLLATYGRAAAAFRNRHRMRPDAPFRVLLPAWVADMIQVDLAREMPGASTERLAVSMAQIQQFWAARNINITWFWDSQEFSVPQATGPLEGWPSTVEGYLFHEGAWLFLDGGTLDLGLVRDSVLNSTNDFQMFAETFEAAAFIGVESLAITSDLCPDGTTSNAQDIDPCASGS